jgi:hypothetical protein
MLAIYQQTPEKRHQRGKKCKNAAGQYLLKNAEVLLIQPIYLLILKEME